MPEQDEWEFPEDCERSWRGYLKHFREEIFPMFQENGVSFDTALVVWFTNRLRNAIPDHDASNDPW